MADARPASTVIVGRDGGADGLEILLTQRQHSMRFMGGAFVFPGGTLEPSDLASALAERVAVQPPAWPGENDPDTERGHVLAAVRETFEEVGLLLGAAPLEPVLLATLRAKLLA